MEKYKSPKIEIVYLVSNDIVTASWGGDELPDDEW